MFNITAKVSSSSFFSEPFALELSTFLPGTIYYTVDGSEPDPENNPATQMYQQPLYIADRSNEPNLLSKIRTTYFFWQGPPTGTVYKGTVVRARVFADDGTPVSKTVTNTYFVSEDALERYTLPVVAIAVDPADLFDYHTGIYVPGALFTGDRWTGNYFKQGREWEKHAYLEFYENSQYRAIAQDIGIRTHGGITRSWPQKSLRLYARSDYGMSRFNYQLFPDLEQDLFKRLILRNAGNDMRLTLLRDALAQRLIAENTDLDLQAYRPVIVFINGEYWGIHNLRERLDNHYVELKYGVDRDEVVVLEFNGSISDGQPGDQLHYRELQALLRKGAGCSIVYEQIQTMMDVENFIDYFTVQIYLANTDWPQNNIRYWRKRTDEYHPDAPPGHDGRWRWMVYDTDCGLGLATAPDHNTLAWATRPGHWSTFMLSSLLENPEFRAGFINRMADHINITFDPDYVLQVLDEMQGVLTPEIAEHLVRWPYIPSVSAWERRVNFLRDWIVRRPDYVRQHVVQHFRLPGTARVHLESTPGGRVGISGVEPTLPWTGTYFQGVPVTVRAIAEPGYQFVGWHGHIVSSSPELELALSGDIRLRAVFRAIEQVECLSN